VKQHTQATHTHTHAHAHTHTHTHTHTKASPGVGDTLAPLPRGSCYANRAVPRPPRREGASAVARRPSRGDDRHVGTVRPDLRGGLAVVAEAEHVLARLERGRDPERVEGGGVPGLVALADARTLRRVAVRREGGLAVVVTAAAARGQQALKRARRVQGADPAR